MIIIYLQYRTEFDHQIIITMSHIREVLRLVAGESVWKAGESVWKPGDMFGTTYVGKKNSGHLGEGVKLQMNYRGYYRGYYRGSKHKNGNFEVPF